MLIKFLSYVASLIGARRYKPIIISLGVFVLLITGITVVATALTGGPQDVASVQQSGKQGKQSPAPPSELKGLDRQQAKDEAAKPQTQTPQPSSGAADNPQSSPALTPISTPDITLDQPTISIGKDNQSATVVASTSDGSSVAWSISFATSSAGLDATLDAPKESAGSANAAASATVRLKTTNGTPGDYTVTVTAKDTARNLTISKTILVTISQ